ncbi:MAG: phosphohistidine phosphatase SixA [Ignavibacteriaceae bacterium]|nr:phosphohistidine phosphatase SixA [Ignavibacteriaceae bacterium]
MNIYLIRHAEAEQTSDVKPHEERELTPRGIERLKASAEIWEQYFNEIDMILSSPLKRAMQTAEIIRKIFEVKMDVVEEISLLNGGQTEDLLNLSGSLGLNELVMIGHQPDIGIHISIMTGANELNCWIPPATIAKISFDGNPRVGKGKLEFLIPPIVKKG